jgi:hypothetical protein
MWATRKRVRGLNHAVTVVASLLVGFPPALWANVTATPIGILGGKGIAGEGKRSFEILERRLQRWIEDSQQRRLRVADLQGSEIENRSQLELERLQLQQLAQENLTPTPEGGVSDAGAESRLALESLVTRLMAVHAFGPQLQLGLVALACHALGTGQRARAGVWVQQAQALHPEGKLAAVLPWAWEQHPQRAALESLWAETTLGAARSCRLNVVSAEPLRALFVNGFAVASSELFVTPGRAFSFSQKQALEEVGTVIYSCSGPGERTVRLEAEPVLAWGWDAARKFALSKISQRKSVATLLVLDKHQDQYSIYLFTPGLGVDVVPTERPLRSDDIRSQLALPISWESLDGLIQKHQREAIRMASIGNTGQPDALKMALSQAEPLWYERPSTWVIAGIIASGIAVAVMASRKEAPVRSHTGFTIQLD